MAAPLALPQPSRHHRLLPLVAGLGISLLALHYAPTAARHHPDGDLPAGNLVAWRMAAAGQPAPGQLTLCPSRAAGQRG